MKPDVDALNTFFHLPCIFVGADGSALLFRAGEDISVFHRPRLDLFRKGGDEKPKNKDFDVVPIGSRSALVSVSWSYVEPTIQSNEDGRYSYPRSSGCVGCYLGM